MLWWMIAIGLIFIPTSLGMAGEPVVAPRPLSTPCEDCQFNAPPWRGPADGGPRLPQADQPPRPLPMPEDAIPLSPLTINPEIKALVERHLGDLTPAEQQIWIEELNGLPVAVARQLLLTRERAGGADALKSLQVFEGFEPPVQGEPPRADRRSPRRETHEQSLKILREAEGIILNNIANAQTVGFKRVAPLTCGGGTSRGVSDLTRRRVVTQGPFRETGRSLDLALEGAGMFQVERDGALGLTRRGLFHVNAEGALAMTIDQQQWLLHPQIDVPPEASGIQISRDGTIHCRIRGGGPIVSVGRIELVLVADQSQLEAIGTGVWSIPRGIVPRRTGAAGDAGFAEIRSGFLEGSNVTLSEELAALGQIRMQIEALAE